MSQSLETRLQAFEDYQSIVQLKSRYCDYCDRHEASVLDARFGPAAVADLFIADGVWDATPDGPRVEGREAIRRSFVDRRATPFISSHSVTNPIIRIDGDSATGQWNAIFYTRSAQAESIAFGTYHEEYLRAADGWYFKTLRLKMIGVAGNPSSRF